ncbi:ABC transporter permease [Naumannella sp. ID2617S]|nr:ABC transporter permease [Naumannella sp. ID2617S]
MSETTRTESELTPSQLAWRRFRSHKLAMIGSAVLLLFLLVSFLGPLLYSVDPYAVDTAYYRLPPGPGHPLGTDSAGRDVLARLLHGGRLSLTIGLTAALLATVLGVLLGIVAGYFRGWIDSVLTRIAEVFQSFPILIVIIVVVAIFGSGVLMIIVMLGCLTWTQAYRVTRGVTMQLREQDSVQAVEGLGGTPVHILLRHMLPAVLPHASVTFTLLTATVIGTEAALSFLGLGVPPPTPSWGSMISEAQSLRILKSMPWMWLPPGAAIALTVLAVNFVGDGLRDAVDPRQVR